MKKTALNKIIGIVIITLLLGASYSIVLASDRTQTAPDEEPPQILNVIVDPENQTENGSVNISCTVIDNVAVAQVTANITYPDTSIHNETMIYNNQTDLAYFNTTYSMIGEYSFYIWAADNSSNSNQSESFVFNITEGQNNPPNLPSNPNPPNGATGVATNTILEWDGGDPDGDIVYYDVFFGVNASPPLVSENQLNTTYNPDLELGTTYYWTIWASDEHGLIALGDIWSFTTGDGGNVSVQITFPINPGIYLNDNPLIKLGLLNRFIFYGPIVIKVNATSPVGIDYVIFKIGNRLKEVEIPSSPYELTWRGLLSGKYTITITAYDANGDTATTEIDVIKWRVHPALIAAGTLAALKGLANIAQGKPAFGWTIVRGTAINVKEQGNSLVFRALRLHYTEITGSSFTTGVLRGKKVTISDVGLNRMITLGPFGSLSYIFAISHGNLQEG